MSQAGITLLIIAGLCVLYILDKLPVALVTTIGMLALVFSGGLTFSEAFSCFGSTPVVLTFGMVIIINAIIESGMITEFETILLKMTRRGEKLFLVQILVTAGIISMFTNNTALVAMFMPFIASVAKASRGRIQKKHLYMPLAIGGLIGGTGTLAGSTAPLLASNVLEITGEEPFSFFTTAPVALIILAAVALCYWFFLYDLQVKWFDFPEVDNDVAEEREEELFETKESLDLEGGLAIKEALDGRTVMPVNKKHGIISIAVFLLCVVGFITRPVEWDLGQIACAGAVIVMLTGCVDTRKELRNMMWPALITLGAAVAVPMAIGAGVNPTPVAIACAIGASMAFATPVATTTITMVQVAGYRFKDYFRIGGVVGAVGVTVAWLAIVSIYGLW